jgi:hypothetical protein
MKASIRFFVSYSHLDKEWFAKLHPLLKFDTRVRARVAHIWHDQELKAGDRWEKEIRDELASMDVFLCLISYHFLASDFIKKVELQAALRREKQGETTIVPLLICDMEERDMPHLKPFKPLPAWGRSWRSYEQNGHTMDAHKPIRTGLWQAIDKVKTLKAKQRS